MAPGAENPVPVVIVNAMSPIGLNAVRALGARGVPVHAVGCATDPTPIGRAAMASRYIAARYWFDDAPYESRMVERLVALGRELGRPAALIPVSDRDMILVSAARAQLEPFFRIALPPHDKLELLLNKDRFTALAIARGWPIPATRLPARPEETTEVAAAMRYPCLIKPAWRDPEWFREFGTRKVFVCADAAQLKAALSPLLARGIRALVQEIVPGPETSLVCTFGWFDAQSNPVAEVACHKIRQHPAHYGNTATAETIDDPAALELSRRLVREMGLWGYVNVEYKRDPADGALKIIEMTPARPNRQVGVCAAGGVDLLWVWYRRLVGLSVDGNAPVRIGTRWASEMNELRALADYLRAREVSPFGWMASLMRADAHELWSRRDPAPALMFLWASAGWLAGRLSRRR